MEILSSWCHPHSTAPIDPSAAPCLTRDANLPYAALSMEDNMDNSMKMWAEERLQYLCLCSSWPLLEKMSCCWWQEQCNPTQCNDLMVHRRYYGEADLEIITDTFWWHLLSLPPKMKADATRATEMTRYILDLDMAGRENLSSRRFIAQYGSGWRQCWSGYRKRSPKDTTAFSFSRQIISLASRQIFATCKPKWRNPQLNFFGRYNEW